MDDKNKIAKFLSYFGELDNIEICNRKVRFSLDEVQYYNEQRWDNVYFVGEVEKWAPRCSDKTIISKKYFYLDFDVRQGRYQKDGYIMSDDEIFEVWEQLICAFKDSIFSDWTFFVFSGNGFQVHWIGKESFKIDLNDYSKAVKCIMNYCAELLESNKIDIKLDFACSNIARLWRLPYTYNYSRWNKFWLPLRKAEVWRAQKDVRCSWVTLKDFMDFSWLYWPETVIDEDTYVPKEVIPGGEDEMEAINNIPIENLVYDYCWLRMQSGSNWEKNFKSLKDWDNIWLFKKDNHLVWKGTHYIHEPKNGDGGGWNCFWFVREHYWLSTEETFKRFEDKYFYIKEIGDRNRKLFKEQKVKEEFVAAQKKVEEAQNTTVDDIKADKQKMFESIKDVDSIYREGVAVEWMTDNLNDWLWKILLGSMNIMVWAPNSWKTTFMYVMIMHNLRRWLKVGLLTYEMRLQDIIEQYYFWQIGAMSRYDSAQITDEDNQKTMEYKRELVLNDNFYCRENLSCGLSDLKADIERMKKFGANVVFIDNLVKIRRTNNEFTDNTAVIEYLYQVSKATGMAIIILHHSDKPSANKNEFGFRWTWDVLIKPDNVFFLKRPWLKISDRDSLSADEKAQLIVRKQKQRSGTSKLWDESVYFYKWWYYDLKEWWQKMGWL